MKNAEYYFNLAYQASTAIFQQRFERAKEEIEGKIANAVINGWFQLKCDLEEYLHESMESDDCKRFRDQVKKELILHDFIVQNCSDFKLLISWKIK